VDEPIEQSFLVKSRVYVLSTPDLTGVRLLAGDYPEVAACQPDATP
jgi:hypothetical protein